MTAPWGPDDEARARALLSGATPRPWKQLVSEWHHDRHWSEGPMVHTRAQANRDAALIAAAPDLLERALAEIERLRTRAACEEIKAVAAERRADELRAEAGRLRESLVNTQMALDIVTASVENARRG